MGVVEEVRTRVISWVIVDNREIIGKYTRKVFGEYFRALIRREVRVYIDGVRIIYQGGNDWV